MPEAISIIVDGANPYPVVIGAGVSSRVADMVPQRAIRVAVLHAPVVTTLARQIVQSLRDAGREVLVIELPDAENAKTVDVVADCWNRLGSAGFTRSDAIVAVGGGATTDVAGFVAASWLRGVDSVLVPTTTLGMVDAAVGGKTGINTARGKNLVGAFHPPIAVLCDPSVLSTLPLIDHNAGLAEVVKAGFIADPEILALIERDPSATQDAASGEVLELLQRAVAVKARVVGADLRERATTGLSREFLNYGHTFGHAVELVENYTWRHGHAVAVGMVYVAELAYLMGRIDRSLVERHRSILQALDLPITYRGDCWSDLQSAMRIDKKARGTTLRFVVLDGLAQPVVVEAPDDTLLEAAYRAVAE